MVKNKYAILILAAGGSKRLGRPKQLVKWKHGTLLNHTIKQALSIENCDVHVALGGNQAAVASAITFNVRTIDISNWKDGMGTTISVSLNQIGIDEYDAIILSVCDQPYISTAIFDNLLNEFEKGNSSIIISKYKNASGPPTLFGKTQYKSLLQLQGDNGAKTVVRNNSEDVSFIQFDKGEIDIDTENDLKKLMDTQNGIK